MKCNNVQKTLFGETINNITDNTVKDKKHDIIDLEDPTIQVDVDKGDLFQLGNHRLICGDGMDKNVLETLMNDVKADTVFTDPPYDLTECAYNDIVKDYSENANVFIMNDDRDAVEYLKESELEFVQFIIADFMFTLPRNNRPYLQHIIMTHETNGDAQHCRNLNKGIRSIIRMKYRGFLNDDIRIHKHQKSIDFVKIVLEHYAVTNVLDIFGGGGTTLIACEELDLNCFMVEIEPRYVQGIIDRWENYTGKKAVKLNLIDCVSGS